VCQTCILDTGIVEAGTIATREEEEEGERGGGSVEAMQNNGWVSREIMCVCVCVAVQV